MKAVIMAGGEGSRLRPLTSNAPKPMMPLVNRPMMEHIIRLLAKHGFDDIVVTLAFMPNAIRTYFGDGSAFGVRMQYATEEHPLGTAGSVRNAMDKLDERFLVISGDVLTDIDLRKIVDFHDEHGALATIGLTRVDNPLEFGIVITREDGSIERFLEKPNWGQVFSDTINTGIFVCEPEIFDYIEADRSVDFSSEVFPKLLEDGKPMFGAIAEGYWEDVGTLEAYVRAHKDMLDGRVEVDIPGFEVSRGVWLGEGAELDPAATIEGPAVIGDNCRIEAGAHLGEYAVLGSSVRVRSNANVERCVVLDNAYIGNSVSLRGAVIGRSCDLRQGARAEEGVVLGDECFIGENAVLSPGVKVYPFKTVETGAVINSSIVWESHGARRLFGGKGITGLANVDITPELAARVAMAYGSTLQKDSTVVTSRDSSRAARMLKRAMMAGFNAAGVNVLDLEVASVPVTRFQLRSPRVSGGVTVRLADDDDQSVRLQFFDESGADLSEDAQRKIERLFYREDFRRVFPGEIGDIGFPPRVLEHYALSVESSVDVSAIRHRKFKLVVDYGYGSTSFAMPNLLAKLGADVLARNPYASTRGAIGFDRRRNAEELSSIVKASGGDLGAVIDPDGERLTLVDDRGRVIEDTEAMFLFLTLLAQTEDKPRAALPVTTSLHAERLLEKVGGGVSWTKLASQALCVAARDNDVHLGADGAGGFVFPQFLPAFDAAASLIKLLAMLSKVDGTLSAMVSELPTPHVVRDSVVTPWESKGAVMRGLMEQSKDRDLVLVDGVKVVHEGGWALAIPDPDEPVTHVWAEAATEAEARNLVSEYSRRVRQMLR